MSKKNSEYWAYNMPLQVWFDDGNEEGSEPYILNYSPRKQSVNIVNLSEVIGDQTQEEFFDDAAAYFENLALLLRNAANGSNENIYYHDAGME